MAGCRAVQGISLDMSDTYDKTLFSSSPLSRFSSFQSCLPLKHSLSQTQSFKYIFLNGSVVEHRGQKEMKSGGRGGREENKLSVLGGVSHLRHTPAGHTVRLGGSGRGCSGGSGGSRCTQCS